MTQHLSDKQAAFVREYLIDRNATDAYIRAGYKGRSRAAAQAASSRLLCFVMVQKAIEEGTAKQAERTQVTADWVVQEAVANYHRCVEAGQYGHANKALELLGRHTGAFQDAPPAPQGRPENPLKVESNNAGHSLAPYVEAIQDLLAGRLGAPSAACPPSAQAFGEPHG